MPVTRQILENYTAFIDGDGCGDDACAHLTVRFSNPKGAQLPDWHWTAATCSLLEWATLNTLAETQTRNIGFCDEVFLDDNSEDGVETKTTIKVKHALEVSPYGYTVLFTGTAEARPMYADHVGGRNHDPDETPIATMDLEIRLRHRPENQEALAKLHLIPRAGMSDRG